MKTVIFNTENAVFKFNKKEVRDHLFGKGSEYAPDEVPQLLELISTDSDETILNMDDNNYFGYVAMEFIGFRKGEATCKLCGKTYDAGQLKESAIGHGKSPFDIKQKQKGGNRLLEKRKNPSMFGGKGFKCPAGHTLISMETWRT
jgi:hypothetical protein